MIFFIHKYLEISAQQSNLNFNFKSYKSALYYWFIFFKKKFKTEFCLFNTKKNGKIKEYLIDPFYV